MKTTPKHTASGLMKSEYHQVVSQEWVKLTTSGLQVPLHKVPTAFADPAVKFSTECPMVVKLKYGIWYLHNTTVSAIHPITFDRFQAET
jgi:hypothetical protein